MIAKLLWRWFGPERIYVIHDEDVVLEAHTTFQGAAEVIQGNTDGRTFTEVRVVID